MHYDCLRESGRYGDLPLVDFDALFAEHMREVLALNGQEHPAQWWEDNLPELYADWLHRPCDALGEIAPLAYYRGAPLSELLALMQGYCVEEHLPPDPLIEAIREYGDEAGVRLLALADSWDPEDIQDCDKPTNLLMDAVGQLLEEFELQNGERYYWRWLRAMTSRTDARAQLALAALIRLGRPDIAQRAIIYLRDTTNAPGALCPQYAREMCAELACGLRHPEAAEAIMDCVAACALPGQVISVPFYAGLLGKLEADDAAIQGLQRMLRLPGLGYLDYVAVRDALESQGIFLDIQPDFEHDPDYQTLVLWGDMQQAVAELEDEDASTDEEE